MKIIYINSFPNYDKDQADYRPGTDGFYHFGMGKFIAWEFLKRNYPVQFESWRMDLRIDRGMEKTFDGVKFRVFPSRKNKILSEWSDEMDRAVRDASKNSDTVFHFMGTHMMKYHKLARHMKKNRVIATHVGGANPWWKMVHWNKKISCLFYLAEKYWFNRYYDHFIAISRPEYEYFLKCGKPAIHMPIFGISNEHVFQIRDRDECRKKLGLPLDKKIILQVGRAIKARGFDWIVRLIDEKVFDDGYHLKFAGIDREDAYYQPLSDRGFKLTGYSSHEALMDYYNAADVLIYLPHGDLDLDFAGTSYVPLEALACGTPVVATTMHHFPGDEIHEVCRIPKQYKDIGPMVREIMNMDISRERCREIVLKAFSWDENIKVHWQIYTNDLSMLIL